MLHRPITVKMMQPTIVLLTIIELAIGTYLGKCSINNRKDFFFFFCILDHPMLCGRKRMNLELELDLALVQAPVCSVILDKPPQVAHL